MHLFRTNNESDGGVAIDVLSITTSDDSRQPYTYEVETDPISIAPPAIP